MTSVDLPSIKKNFINLINTRVGSIKRVGPTTCGPLAPRMKTRLLGDSILVVFRIQEEIVAASLVDFKTLQELSAAIAVQAKMLQGGLQDPIVEPAGENLRVHLGKLYGEETDLPKQMLDCSGYVTLLIVALYFDPTTKHLQPCLMFQRRKLMIWFPHKKTMNHMKYQSTRTYIRVLKYRCRSPWLT